MKGICALCKGNRGLVANHLMPKGVYRSLAKWFPGQGQNLVAISGFDKTAAYSDKQVKKLLLCKDCESRFSQNGEDTVLKLMARPNRFGLASKIEKFPKRGFFHDECWYFSQNEELAFKFLYFAVSISWRLSATEWDILGDRETRGSIRQDSMNSFSEFLLGGRAPENTYMVVYVDNKQIDMPYMSFPVIKDHDGYQHIVFVIPGLKFSLICGPSPGLDILSTFSVNKYRVYFVSRSLKSHPDFDYLINFVSKEATPRGRLGKEFTQDKKGRG